jgi:hypothetical protein
VVFGVDVSGVRPVGPKAGVDYPTSLSQFFDWSHSDADSALLRTPSLAGRLLLREV